LSLIGRALNHSSLAATQIYARLDLNPVREVLENNATLMFGSSDRGHKSTAGAPE
jgi:hypothetical protein